MATAPPAYTPYEEIKALPDGSSSMNAEDQTSILSELESVQRICKNPQGKLDNIDENAIKLRKGQIMSLDRVRWQSEQTNEAQKMAEAALKENRELVAKLGVLEIEGLL
ncbi:uncharacterized protein N7498_001549 [Penicillium cinerascens]|uniref:Uncharacterized protein n=1 Tax=Penicillium cinerascens TaxID=70096 RepID=A0A9W9NGA2_9EURO|nr:uncharacterized protein N7498_001549 [Penicillium cinerascens]KAJ5219450.1 hypothetical protein N7498_001549 [Penicillium cinerascens]